MTDAPRSDDQDELDAAERRRSERAPIELKVEYKRLNGFFADYTRNISRGGTFIGTPRPLPIGTAFLFKLHVPGLEAPLELRGIVTWITTADDATERKPPGMGIRFEYANDAERLGVQHSIEGLIVRNLGPQVGARLVAQTRKRSSEPPGSD